MEELHTDSIDGGHEGQLWARSRARERAYSNKLSPVGKSSQTMLAQAGFPRNKTTLQDNATTLIQPPLDCLPAKLDRSRIPSAREQNAKPSTFIVNVYVHIHLAAHVTKADLNAIIGIATDNGSGALKSTIHGAAGRGSRTVCVATICYVAAAIIGL